MQPFRFVSNAQEIIFGPGSLAELAEAVKNFGWQRIMLCTSPSQRANGQARKIENLFTTSLVTVFDRVQPHVQDIQFTEVLAAAIANEVDAFIGLGGGSPLGMAKAAAFAMLERPVHKESAGSYPSVAVIAIPTTYAGSEMTAVYGITNTRETPPRKITVSNPKIAPRLVLYDPALTLDLPPQLTASTGMNALAHCMEALYSISRNPLSSAAALAAVRCISGSLFACYSRGDDLEKRSQMLLGAHLAGFSLSNVSMGLHHGLCHVLGGTAGVPHGIANSIILPHAIRFNAPACADLLSPAAQAFGIPTEGIEPPAAVNLLIQKITALSGQMGLPQRLRDVNVNQDDLPELARLAFHNQTVQNNPRPITEPGQIEQLLNEAW